MPGIHRRVSELKGATKSCENRQWSALPLILLGVLWPVSNLLLHHFRNHHLQCNWHNSLKNTSQKYCPKRGKVIPKNYYFWRTVSKKVHATWRSSWENHRERGRSRVSKRPFLPGWALPKAQGLPVPLAMACNISSGKIQFYYGSPSFTFSICTAAYKETLWRISPRGHGGRIHDVPQPSSVFLAQITECSCRPPGSQALGWCHGRRPVLRCLL